MSWHGLVGRRGFCLARTRPLAQIKFVAVLKGNCWLTFKDESTPLQVKTGEVFMLPAERDYVLAGEMNAPQADGLFAECQRDRRPVLSRLNSGSRREKLLSRNSRCSEHTWSEKKLVMPLPQNASRRNSSKVLPRSLVFRANAPLPIRRVLATSLRRAH